jgi:predicted transcriptional regulator
MAAIAERRKDKKKRRIRLDPDRRGYFLDGELVRGFEDPSDLSTEERTFVARWAERFGADLSDEQQKLLRQAPSPQVSNRQRALRQNQEELQSAYVKTLFDGLNSREQRLIRDPSRHQSLRNKTYPLTIGDLHTLTGASERQLRSWADEGLLPSFRDGRDRQFFSGALIRAFALTKVPHYEKAVVAAASRGDLGRLFQLVAATLGTTAVELPSQLSRQVSSLAEELSRSSELMRDVAEQSSLKRAWRTAHARTGTARSVRARNVPARGVRSKRSGRAGSRQISGARKPARRRKVASR